jgi:hypothetical protein
MKNILRITALFLVTSLTWAQQTTGKISGQVTDNAGAGLVGANVIVDGTSMGVATDNNGKYTILNVPAGTYALTASYIGYRSTTTSNVEVKTNLTTPQNFSMESSAIEGDAITIVGQKRLVEFSATNSVRSVNAEEIQNAASRSVTGMLDMQAGVTITNGNLHIRGSRAEEVAYTLDGAQITDVINTGRDVSAIPEALAEITVEAGGYGAHVGGANSGVVRQTMRTGGNQMGGNVRFETGDFGHQDVTATLGGPLGPVRFFGAVRQSHTDDSNPSFFTDFMIDLDGNGEADVLNSYISGVTLEDATKKINFDTDDGAKVAHRKQDNLQVNGTALMDLGPINLRLSGVIDNESGERNGLPIRNMFNADRQSEYERNLSMMTVRGNYFVNPDMLVTVGVSTLNRSYESYDGLFGKPGDFTDALGWGDSATVVSKYSNEDAVLVGNNWRSTYQRPYSYFFGQFPFAREGDMATGWSKNERSSTGLDAGLTWQKGDHEIRLGFDTKSYTYRKYYLDPDAITGVNRMIADTSLSLTLANAVGNAGVETELVANNLNGQIGYDDYGVEIDGDGMDGARTPFTTSFYVNDKYEAGDVVISVGVRADQFNMDDWKLIDPLNPPWDETNKSVFEDKISDSDTKLEIQPRLGMAFPVSDEIVFHLQYGKFAQMPELDLPYASTRYMGRVWGGQNYISSPMGFDLDPVLTTQYEVGVSYQFLPDAAIDVTAFAKNTTGQIVLNVNPNVPLVNDYNAYNDAPYYTNGDFTTVNGFEFTLRTRRINRLQSFVSYTYSDARGVNSDPNSNAGNLAQSMLSPPPMMINPLYYTNKHRGAVSLDYRFGKEAGLLSGLGANVQYKFNSGHPYTLSDGGMGQRAAYAGALLTDARSREPQEPIGQSTTPWQTNINLKVDYNINVGNYGLTVFAYVENLMNTKNVENVYSRSGNAYDDGFLTDPALSSEIVAAQGDIYTTMYENVNLDNRQHYISDYGRDLFSTPRIVKFGASVNF